MILGVFLLLDLFSLPQLFLELDDRALVVRNVGVIVLIRVPDS